MTEKTKNYVGWALIIALVAVAVASLSYVNAYREVSAPTAYRSFSIAGEGRAVGVPDVARFSFSVVTEGGTNVGQLQTDNTGKVNKAIEFVKGEGVAAADIQTAQYQIEPRYKNAPVNIYGQSTGEPPTIVGYTVRQTVNVKVRAANFAKLGDLLSGVVNNGANQVSQLSFEVDDPAAIEAEARAKAIAEAREKAAAVAKAGGFRVGRLLSIDENGPMPYYKAEAMDMAYGLGGVAAPSVPAPRIEPGSQEFNVTLTLRYEIK
jgi:uncharacterized protein YggE